VRTRDERAGSHINLNALSIRDQKGLDRGLKILRAGLDSRGRSQIIFSLLIRMIATPQRAVSAPAGALQLFSGDGFERIASAVSATIRPAD